MALRNPWVVVLIVVGVIVVAGVLMGIGMWGFWIPGGVGPGAGIALMVVGMVLFWGLIIGGAVWLVVSLVRQPRPNASVREDSATETLRRLYARGEISREEFLRRRQDLEER
ncbi:MAG: SHOCT domain-containing protein [Chloroflexota bacterium]